MKTMLKIPATMAAIAVAALCAAAAPSNTSAKGPDFETLKQLAGDWEVIDPAGKMTGTVHYDVTSANSAVVETMFVGEPHEMVTVYTRDGDRLAVTHYCAAGNQPHLQSKQAAAPNQLKFDFSSAGNMKSVNDEHMHSLTLTFLDADHVKQEWQSYKDGKPVAGTTILNLKRKTAKG